MPQDFSLLARRGTRGLPPPQPIDFPSLQAPSSPNWALAAPPGGTTLPHTAVPLLPVTPAGAWEVVSRLGDRFTRTWPHRTFPEMMQAHWVVRTRLMNYPDLVTAQVVELPGGAGLWLYSRSVLGYSDLGVNGRRIAAWIAALTPALRTA